ncbi:hypothetical protein GUJ93_ZPchr0002g25378 [Zizania palustris]|uniref:Terpene synthase n=1 Tax=Zizania palustris TaxID=103762 RepID=A0A8J5VVH2_ZIZPA|nr:hypothetical protein GUJ93_ZPchr0002g25378 [Zizania palustris]
MLVLIGACYTDEINIRRPNSKDSRCESEVYGYGCFKGRICWYKMKRTTIGTHGSLTLYHNVKSIDSSMSWRVFSFASSPGTLLRPAADASPAARDGGRSRSRGGLRCAGHVRSSPAVYPVLLSTDVDVQQVLVERRVGLVNDVKEMLLTASGGRETLATVDHLRRLCIDHYFQDEVDSAMDDVACLQELAHGGDLHDATLAFRLMREAGHHVSPAMTSEGYLLESAIKQLNPNLAKYVSQTLDHPYHVSLMQYKARHHLSYLQTLPTKCTAMEELALVDFQLNKLLHQMEMQEIKSWWLDLGLAQEIPVVRDQIELSKVVAFVYIVDDIFDLVGTHDELSCFTRAIKMWDIALVDSLLSCMRSCYMALYTITNGIADLIQTEYGVNSINHLKTVWAILFDAFMKETEWLSVGHVTDSEDYLRNGIVTS